MAIEIHAKRRPQLVAAIAKALASVRVEHRNYVTHESLGGFDQAQAILAKDEIAALTRHIAEISPLGYFAHGYLNGCLEQRDFENSAEEALVDVPGIPSLAQVAEELVQALQQLPYTYAISLQLSDHLNGRLVDGGPWRMGPNIEVAKGQAFQARFPVRVPDTIADKDHFQLRFAKLMGSPVPKPDNAFLSIKVEGYLQRFTNPGPSHDAADHAIRSVFGLAMVFGVVRYRSRFAQPEPVNVYVHIASGGSHAPHLKFPLSTSTSRALQGLEFLAPLTIGGPEKDSWSALAGDASERIAAVLTHEKGERLARAARWHFDGFGADSLLMQYLQAMICLEILLGEPDKAKRDLSVGATLKNRCAYLIGEDLDERAAIMANLTAIYDVRSEIVHNGLGRLGGRERQLLATLRWYCARVIWVEAGKLGGAMVTGAAPGLDNGDADTAGED